MVEYDDYWLRMDDLNIDLQTDGPPFEKVFGRVQLTIYRTLYEKDPPASARTDEQDLAAIHAQVLELNRKILTEGTKHPLTESLADLVISIMQFAERLGVDLAASIVERTSQELHAPRKHKQAPS